MTRSASINPFYAARLPAATSASQAERRPDSDQPVYARLPRAPRTASPVPHLTSLYHFDGTDQYGDRRYPGNCGGRLIEDLLTYFRPRNVFDPMAGSGTCGDVCTALGSPSRATVIRVPLCSYSRTLTSGLVAREKIGCSIDPMSDLGIASVTSQMK